MLTRFIVVLAFIWLVRGNVTENSATEDSRNVRSETMRKIMNESADPCESFFDFACGNWNTQHPINNSVRQTRSFMMAIDEFNPILSQLLTAVTEADGEAERKVKTFYESCLNTAAVKAADRKRQLKEMLREFGEMPALRGTSWSAEDFDWLQTVAKISHKYGIQLIYGYDIIVDGRDHTSHAVVMKNQKFEENLLGDHRQLYETMIANNLKQYLSLKPKAAKRLATTIVDFEAILHEASIEKDADDSMVPTTMEQLAIDHSPDLDIKQLVNISLGFIPSGEVLDFTPSYVEGMIEALEATPKEAVANFIFYQLLNKFIEQLPTSKIKLKLENQCIELVKKSFAPIVSKLFYRVHNANRSKQDLEEMWQAIKATAGKILESSRLNWYDEDEAREEALEKLHSMQMKIASFEERNFDAEYRELTFDKDDYIGNLRALMSFNAAQKRASLEVGPDYLQLGLKLTTPTYILLSNTIIFPASVLTTDYFWSNSQSKALSFSRLGFLVAHEVLHGFSGSGRTYNKLGNLLQWLDEEVEDKFQERSACLSQQYHNITYGDKPLPQDPGQGENTADTGGLVIAYDAYMHWYAAEERTKEELDWETLPNLNYTHKQLFYISYAQMWCAITDEPLRALLATMDKHSPDEIRSYVPLMNFGKFSEEFNCPLGSGMNPAKKCAIF